MIVAQRVATKSAALANTVGLAASSIACKVSFRLTCILISGANLVNRCWPAWFAHYFCLTVTRSVALEAVGILTSTGALDSYLLYHSSAGANHCTYLSFGAGQGSKTRTRAGHPHRAALLHNSGWIRVYIFRHCPLRQFGRTRRSRRRRLSHFRLLCCCWSLGSGAVPSFSIDLGSTSCQVPCPPFLFRCAALCSCQCWYVRWWRHRVDDAIKAALSGTRVQATAGLADLDSWCHRVCSCCLDRMASRIRAARPLQ